MAHKVTAVQNNGTYQGAYGLMYKQEVTLDDGTTGEVSAKTEGKWKVGDTVEVQRTETQYGTRFKFAIPQIQGAPAPRSGGYKKDPETELRIEASWAIGQAVATGAKTHDKLVSQALALLDARNAVITALKGAKEEQANDTGATPGENLPY